MTDGPTSMAIREGRPARDLEDDRLAASLGARLFGRTEQLRVDRFVIERRLGAGGMGVVYEATDPRLQRKVALKVLRSVAAEDDVLAEARAAAKIRHPHVVEVFDSGQDGQHVWIAMELCPGPSLDTWCRTESRPWRAVVELFVQCGEALAAGHRLDVVHRDFKPANVIVESPSPGRHRAKVVDFGLASLDRAKGSVPIGGTPAFMAPEQARGDAVDGRADQFALCASLGQVLGLQDRDGAERTPARLPRWLRAAIRRGLAQGPADRFASMDDLVATLRRGLMRRRRVALGLMGAVTVVAVGGGVVAVATRGPDPCSAVGTEVDSVWPAARRDEVQRWFRDADPQTDAVARFVEPVDGWVEHWTQARAQQCERAATRGPEESTAGLEEACLRRSLAVVDGFVGAVVESTPSVTAAGKAVSGAQQLPGLSACEDLTVLLREIPPSGSPERQQQIRALDHEIASFGGRLRFGYYGDVQQETADHVQRAQALGHAPLLARALRLHGHALSEGGDSKAALALADRSYVAAIEGRTDLVASDAAMLAAWVLVRTKGDLERAAWWLEQARAWIEPLDDPGSWAEWHDSMGGLQFEHARYAAAIEHYAQALEIRRSEARVRGSEWSSLNGLAMSYAELGQLDRAIEQSEQALAKVSSVLGDDHPYRALALNNLGVMALRAGDDELALRSLKEALRIKRRELGNEHPALASTLNNLGSAEWAVGRVDAALGHQREAIAVLERALPPDDFRLAAPIFNYAVSLAEADKYEQALEHYERAAGLYEARHGEAHPAIVGALVGRGQALIALGRVDEARALLMRGYALAETVTLGKPDRAELLLELGRLRLADAPAVARQMLSEAQSLCRGDAGPLCRRVHEALGGGTVMQTEPPAAVRSPAG